jgi:lysophospholipase L1-like esterase
VKRIAGRVLLLGLGVFLSAVLLEGALQLGALVVRQVTAGEPPAWATRDLRVLCLGDSNTYGLHMERKDAYPQQLATLWRSEGYQPALEVLNLGVPGTNSSRILSELPRILSSLEPNVVILMVGANDYWTLPVPFGEAQVNPVRRWLSYSRVYQGFRMARRALDPPTVDVILDETGDYVERRDHVIRYGDEQFEMGFSSRPARDVETDDLRANLRRLIHEIRRREAQVVLMTYPARFRKLYPRANRELRSAARYTKAPLVDLAAVFEQLCRTEECPEYLLRDLHPTALGYSVVAETLARELREILGATR